MAITEPRGGECSAVSARGGDTSSRRRLRCWLRVGTSNGATRGQRTVTSTKVGPVEYYELSSDDGRPTVRERPAALLEPLPREKLQRHAGTGYEVVQSLDVPVLQVVEQLPNIVQFFAAHLPVVAELVIEVPKILPDRVPQRIVERRPPQMAEQLVEVLTEPVYVLMVLASTVYSWRELSPLLSAQGSTASGSGLEEVVDNPVPQGRRRRGGSSRFAPWTEFNSSGRRADR